MSGRRLTLTHVVQHHAHCVTQKQVPGPAPNLSNIQEELVLFYAFRRFGENTRGASAFYWFSPCPSGATPIALRLPTLQKTFSCSSLPRASGAYSKPNPRSSFSRSVHSSKPVDCAPRPARLPLVSSAGFSCSWLMFEFRTTKAPKPGPSAWLSGAYFDL